MQQWASGDVVDVWPCCLLIIIYLNASLKMGFKIYINYVIIISVYCNMRRYIYIYISLFRTNIVQLYYNYKKDKQKKTI